MITHNLHGAVARARHKLLHQSGNEIQVACHHRDAHGASCHYDIRLGKSDFHAWILVVCTSGDETTELAFAAVEEAERLHEDFLADLLLRMQLVNSSPLSPEMCQLTPGLDKVVALLDERLGVKVDPWSR